MSDTLQPQKDTTPRNVIQLVKYNFGQTAYTQDAAQLLSRADGAGRRFPTQEICHGGPAASKGRRPDHGGAQGDPHRAGHCHRAVLEQLRRPPAGQEDPRGPT
jgi:hypothetical protein